MGRIAAQMETNFAAKAGGGANGRMLHSIEINPMVYVCLHCNRIVGPNINAKIMHLRHFHALKYYLAARNRAIERLRIASFKPVCHL